MSKHRKQKPRRLLKVSCLGAGFLTLSNSTYLMAADIGLYDVHNDLSLGVIPNPFSASPLGVHVAVGDLDGDGFGDIIMGPGEGAPSVVTRVKTSDKHNKAVLDFIRGAAFPGVGVATGDVNGDNRDDLIVGVATGLGSEAAVLQWSDALNGLDLEMPLATSEGLFPSFSGGVRLAVGDYEGDGLPNIVAVQAGTVDPRWKKMDIVLQAATDFESPFAFNAGGLQVAMGDLDDDGADEIVMLADSSPDGFAHLKVNNHKDKAWRDVLFFDEPAGVHVALGDVDGDGRGDLVVGAPRGYDPYIRIYALEDDPMLTGDLQAKLSKEFLAYEPTFRGGVRVAAGDINGDGRADVAFAPASIPEPSTIASLFSALAAWLFGRRRQRHRAAS